MTPSQSAEEYRARSCSETHSIFINSPGRDVHSSSSSSGRHMYWSLQAASFREAAQQSWSICWMSSGKNYAPESRHPDFILFRLQTSPEFTFSVCAEHLVAAASLSPSHSSFQTGKPPEPPFFSTYSHQQEKQREVAGVGQGASFGEVWGSIAHSLVWGASC